MLQVEIQKTCRSTSTKDKLKPTLGIQNTSTIRVDFGSFPPEFFTEVAGHDQNISKIVFLKRKLRWFSYFPLIFNHFILYCMLQVEIQKTCRSTSTKDKLKPTLGIQNTSTIRVIHFSYLPISKATLHFDLGNNR
jgi:hypothetical protein